MAIHVKSEIGKLKKVMLHRPGQELEHLVPEDLERLLFDDIPYLKTAKSSMICLRRLCRDRGGSRIPGGSDGRGAEKS